MVAHALRVSPSFTEIDPIFHEDSATSESVEFACMTAVFS